MNKLFEVIWLMFSVFSMFSVFAMFSLLYLLYVFSSGKAGWNNLKSPVDNSSNVNSVNSVNGVNIVQTIYVELLPLSLILFCNFVLTKRKTTAVLGSQLCHHNQQRHGYNMLEHPAVSLMFLNQWSAFSCPFKSGMMSDHKRDFHCNFNRSKCAPDETETVSVARPAASLV